MMYEIAVHENAHEPPTRIQTADSISNAFGLAGRSASRLYSETDDYEVGEAGEDELFEVYPKRGHGTVVVSTITPEERISSLCDSGLEATAHAEIDDAEQAFRDILEVVDNE